MQPCSCSPRWSRIFLLHPRRDCINMQSHADRAHRCRWRFRLFGHRGEPDPGVASECRAEAARQRQVGRRDGCPARGPAWQRRQGQVRAAEPNRPARARVRGGAAGDARGRIAQAGADPARAGREGDRSVRRVPPARLVRVPETLRLRAHPSAAPFRGSLRPAGAVESAGGDAAGRKSWLLSDRCRARAGAVDRGGARPRAVHRRCGFRCHGRRAEGERRDVVRRNRRRLQGL